MTANDFINEVFSKEFADTKEIKPYYQKMSKIKRSDIEIVPIKSLFDALKLFV